MKETKPNTPAEFSVQSQFISEEELDSVVGGLVSEACDSVAGILVDVTKPGSQTLGPKAYF